MKNKVTSALLLFALVAAMISAAWPRADVHAQGDLITVTIQGDGAAMSDTYMSSSAPTTNNGTNTVFAVGENNTASSVARGLLQFDLSGLPNDLTVVSATVSLWVSADHSDNARVMSAYAIQAGRNWVETQATWNNYKTSVAWGTAGGGNTTNDIVGTAIGTVSVANNLTAGTQVDIILDPGAVQSMRWQDYFGFELQMATENNDRYDFVSSDNATSGQRPKIVIEYYADTPTPDPGWKCYEGQNGGEILYVWPDCAPGGASDPPVMSPYIAAGGSTTVASVGGFIVNESAATLQCTPYPQCVNNFPIYYRLTYDANWTKGGGGLTSTFHTDLIVLGAPIEELTSGCGTGNSGACFGTFQGTISPTDLPSNQDGGYTVGVQSYFEFSGIVGSMTHREINWTIYFSLEPFDQNCADTWFVPVPDTFVIDPTIETPVGSPTDDQKYTTVPDAEYMIRVQHGPWNDGAADRTDAEFGIDSGLGVIWHSWDEAPFWLDVVCIDTDPTNPNYDVYYFTAHYDNFYIRVADTPTNFADNTNDGVTPFEYVIGVAFEIAEPVSCESQFTYDEMDDLVSSVTIEGTSEFTLANSSSPLTVGDWYGITVENDTTWNETGGSPRTDMEKQFYGTHLNADPFSDLADGSSYTWCASTDGLTIFVQAPAESLNLRVNDQDDPQNFTDNEDSLDVSIFHATFNRTVTGCELQFDLGQLLDTDSVQGDQVYGKAFGSYVSSFDSSLWSSDDVNAVQWDWTTFSFEQVPGLLVPGGWYTLQTIEGPWTLGTAQSYDMQIKVGGDDWVDLADWSGSECTVPVDALGHVRMYFQIPEDEDLFGQPYLLRVASTNFLFTGGAMGWQLYQAIDYGINDDESGMCADYIYDPDQLHPPGGYVEANKEDGQFIVGMDPGSFRAIRINSSATASDPPDYRLSGWFESTSSSTELDGLQITTNGTTWQSLPDAAGVLCHFNLPESDDLVFFVRPQAGQTWKLRADSSSFANNTGIEIYHVYTAAASDTIDKWTRCSEDYTATVPAINEAESIPVQESGGVPIMPTLSYTPGLENNLTGIPPVDDLLFSGVHLWGDAPTIAPDHDYMISIARGPWYDGENPDQRYNADLSSDGGETWYSFSDHPDVICSTVDQLRLYEKAIFHASTGQVWKIRVGDGETETFDDNSGQLWYRLNLVNEFPIDGPGALAINGYDPNGITGPDGLCSSSLIAPTTTITDIASVGPFFGDRIQYYFTSSMAYVAWCPRHAEMILAAIRMLQTKEPLATINEMAVIANEVKKEVDAYSWDGGGLQDTSIFDAHSSADIQNIFNQHVLPQSGAGASPWEEGGDLVNFSGDTSLPSYYYTCQNVFANYLPSRLQSPVCFASAYWKETGASFWIQLLLDVSAIFMMFNIIKSSIQSLVYMMTGVRPWTKDGAQRLIVDIARGENIVSPDRWRSRR